MKLLYKIFFCLLFYLSTFLPLPVNIAGKKENVTKKKLQFSIYICLKHTIVSIFNTIPQPPQKSLFLKGFLR